MGQAVLQDRRAEQRFGAVMADDISEGHGWPVIVRGECVRGTGVLFSRAADLGEHRGHNAGDCAGDRLFRGARRGRPSFAWDDASPDREIRRELCRWNRRDSRSSRFVSAGGAPPRQPRGHGEIEQQRQVRRKGVGCEAVESCEQGDI